MARDARSLESASGRPAAILLAVAILVGFVPAVSAATFTVNPTQIYFSGRTVSALLTVRNDSDETLRFQLSVFSWSQSPSGEPQLQPTQDIVFFPALLTLAPKEERKIRVGSSTKFGATEKTYRIFVEELPPTTRPGNAGAAIRVLTKMGVPIFLRPAKEVAQGGLSDLEMRNGTLHFNVRNSGTVHFMPQTIKVRGTAASGATVFERQLEGWYILAGGYREYDLSLPKPDCAKVTALAVEVQVGPSTLKDRLETPPAACTP